MRILLLGGTGAMGVALKSILEARGDEVYITSRSKHEDEKNIHYLLGDAHNDNFMSDVLKDKYDAIVDFMIYRSGEFADKVERLLKATDQYIFTSSSRVYADSDKPITEETPRLLDICKDEWYLKTDEYALAKAREENVLFYSRHKNWTIIRPYITYNTERLQLGAIEKDLWLYRAMHGRSIPFPKDVAACQTTMTYGGDVAKAIASLIGEKSAIGEVFHLTGTEHMTWADILDIYLKVLETETGINPRLYIPEDSFELSMVMNNFAQVHYDRRYNRVFDNSKLMEVVGTKLTFTPMEEGLENCLSCFLKNPMWKGKQNWRLDAYINRQTGERMPYKEIGDATAQLKYLGWRYMPAVMATIIKMRRH